MTADEIIMSLRNVAAIARIQADKRPEDESLEDIACAHEAVCEAIEWVHGGGVPEIGG
jgi:hypothetical protein